MDDVMLPGFRFHPTDEELVGFYLKKKIQQRVLPIELIKQVDIYKYDPWDLPNLAPAGEKEWYFYCPRDRKYRNSARPNRVTGAGFWKATGTDRPIYSSDGTNCIGLKKSLVFYRGRAAKGIKTDWMMHEFRLPSLSQSQLSQSKGILDKSLPPNPSHLLIPNTGLPSGFMFSTMDASGPTAKMTSDEGPILINLDTNILGDARNTSGNMGFGEPQQFNDFSMNSPQEMQGSIEIGDHEGPLRLTSDDHEWVKVQTSGFPFSPPSTVPDDWNHDMPWDSPSNSINMC
ncbi:hypothetical protein E3N88_12564 [Mikania micrantha]|uniref:NAC domain-containing protein n=1 Tax=Mikania micrantha TaxID=192012 RepID=A0A5N6P5W0_9ASTR|nr:hypothetical protein E3N88_12564 [Mikania micrantha]